MPKPMLRQQHERNQTNMVLNGREGRQQERHLVKAELDRLLRRPRSKRYMDALHKLDAGGHANNQNEVNEIIDAIREEFPEVEIKGVLIGYVSRCYLGDPYEVHTLDMFGQIVEHYVRGQMLPDGLERARSIAISGGYEFIEVYIDCCRAINSAGSVSVIPY